jgi:hypothetical protein
MGARHGAQSSAVWTSDSAVVLLDGIEANEHRRGLAEARSQVYRLAPSGGTLELCETGGTENRKLYRSPTAS